MALSRGEIRLLRSLHQKKFRGTERLFMVEGVRLLEEALAAEYLPRLVLHSPGELDERGQRLVAKFAARGVEVKKISAAESRRIADTTSSPGIAAVFPFRLSALEEQLGRRPRKVVVCDQIGDPGNLGTLLRSAAAFGFDLVIATQGSAEITSPKVVRSSMGAYFRMPTAVGLDEETVADALHKCGYALYCADIGGTDLGGRMTISFPVALVVGSEVTGPGDTFRRCADFRIRIPMTPKVESLNAGMAGSILMFWLNLMEDKAQ